MLIRLMTLYYSTAIISILSTLPLIQYYIDFAFPPIGAHHSLSKFCTTRISMSLTSGFVLHCRLPSHVGNYFRLYLEKLAFYIFHYNNYSIKQDRYSQYSLLQFDDWLVVSWEAMFHSLVVVFGNWSVDISDIYIWHLRHSQNRHHLFFKYWLIN